MEAGKGLVKGQEASLDLVDAMVLAADPSVSDEDVAKVERSACPPVVHALACSLQNSMNWAW